MKSFVLKCNTFISTEKKMNRIIDQKTTYIETERKENDKIKLMGSPQFYY